jgi:hypothetical protein
MSATENSDELLSREQAAHLLKVSVRTLSRRHAEGSGPPRIKHGQRWCHVWTAPILQGLI